MVKLRTIVLLCPLVLASCRASSPASSPPDGEGEGMTEAEAAERAAERVGVAVEDLSDCGKACVAYFIAGCTNIRDQCDGRADFAFAGAYVTDCATAKQLACGSVANLESCADTCVLRVDPSVHEPNPWVH